MPFTGACAKRIEDNLMQAWRDGRDVVTKSFQAALSLSFGACGAVAQARAKARRIVKSIRSAADMAGRMDGKR